MGTAQPVIPRAGTVAQVKGRTAPEGRCSSCARVVGSDARDETPLERLTLDELLASLPVLAAEARAAEELMRERVALLKERRATWAEIGSALNVTRQAAWERFGRRSRRAG